MIEVVILSVKNQKVIDVAVRTLATTDCYLAEALSMTLCQFVVHPSVTCYSGDGKLHLKPPYSLPIDT